MLLADRQIGPTTRPAFHQGNAGKNTSHLKACMGRSQDDAHCYGLILLGESFQDYS